MSEENKQLIRTEVNELTDKLKESLDNVKRFAVSEAWKILQLATASVIQIIEKIGTDLSGPEKKKVALEALSNFYDGVFTSVDIPMIPSVLEPMFHQSVKAFLMILVGATIDALVTTFRETGIFIKKQVEG
mgnify:FL=1|tara:strand:+ start:1852 stop:2244 length:393 start_codon:yes stop_codon:yes gene_type:complete